MEERNKNLIEEERNRLLLRLKETEPGSDEAKAIINDLSDLTRMVKDQEQLGLEEKKMEVEDAEKKKQRKHDLIRSIGGWTVSIVTLVGTGLIAAFDWRKKKELSDEYFHAANEDGYYPKDPPEKGLFGSIFRFDRK